MDASLELTALREIITNLHWMARRYADGRSTYAPSLFNDHTRKALELGIELNPTADGTIWAQDGMGSRFDGRAAPPRDAADEERTGPLPAEVARLRSLVRAVLESLRDPGALRTFMVVQLWVRVGQLMDLDRAKANALCEEFGLDPEEGHRPTQAEESE